jgi:nitroreductase
MTVREAIRARRSIRKFKDTKIGDEQIHSILEAAMMAPSAVNKRPWEFVVVKDHDKIMQVRQISSYAGALEHAPLAIIICGRPDLEKGVSEGFFPQDCSAAAENMLLECVGLGLGAIWLGIYPMQDRVKKVTALLKGVVSPEAVPFGVIAIGIADETPAPKGHYDEKAVKEF